MSKNSEIWMTVYLCSVSLFVTSFARESVYVLDYFSKQTHAPIILVVINVFYSELIMWAILCTPTY